MIEVTGLVKEMAFEKGIGIFIDKGDSLNKVDLKKWLREVHLIDVGVTRNRVNINYFNVTIENWKNHHPTFPKNEKHETIWVPEEIVYEGYVDYDGAESKGIIEAIKLIK